MIEEAVIMKEFNPTKKMIIVNSFQKKRINRFKNMYDNKIEKIDRLVSFFMTYNNKQDTSRQADQYESIERRKRNIVYFYRFLL